MFCIVEEEPDFSICMRQKHFLESNYVRMMEFSQQLQQPRYNNIALFYIYNATDIVIEAHIQLNNQIYTKL